MSLHTKYRPLDFSEIIGNEQTVKQLISFCNRTEDRPHTYLFKGERGCGKTTIARICAAEFDCHESDIVEIDVGTNRGIDTVRQLKETIQYKPMFGKNKAYILDEAHAGTKDFWNAFLKSLEEPPEHVYFFLCTTDPQKLIKTVLSRCTQFEVQKLTVKEIAQLLQWVIDDYFPTFIGDVQHLKKIGVVSEGIPREALVILDQVIEIKDSDGMMEAIGTSKTQEKQITDLFNAMLEGKKWPVIAGILNNLKEDEEKVRRSILGLAAYSLLKGKAYKEASILEEFREPFYDTGRPGLILACFNVVTMEQ